MTQQTTKMDEIVPCLPKRWVNEHLDAGLNRFPILDLPRQSGWQYFPRSVAETHRDFVHLVTYGVVTCRDQVFAYRRGKSGSEDRLHDRWSIGVGGHISEEDIGITNSVVGSVREAALRELSEEVCGMTSFIMEYLGLLYDPSDRVGAVHLGVTYRHELASPSAVSREDCLADARWMPIDEAKGRAESFEGWSQILLRDYL